VTPSAHARPEPWPPASPGAPLAVLVSGGVDSAVLLAEAARAYPAVHPLFVRTGLVWEPAELAHLERFLAAIRTPALRPLHVLEVPVRDLYGEHWSLTGVGVPAAGTPDEEVYLPGRNVLLLSKALLWCHLHQVPEVAMAPLAANPFPDATPEFFREFAAAVNRAVGGAVRVLRPYSHLHKPEVLHRAGGLPLEHTFSCIRPAAGRHCGRCSKCYERQVGFREAGLADPTEYEFQGSKVKSQRTEEND
jgi:7-cyano-7-deazaguanine synthase